MTPDALVRTDVQRVHNDPSPIGRMPTRALESGEQYRFHFNMGECIGCKCCVVACNEQNGNPAAINWRRVGDLEGGWYPAAQQFHLSMGCNHCIEPTCLRGCPVDAYSKDPVTGIVRHSADACIGCQYCTWNCSYGVPQYNPERGVVGKCDMCSGRLELDQAPACVSACPEGAIAIEIVRIADWKDACALPLAAQGMPAGDGSVSTTRITMPTTLPPNTRPTDLTHVRPEDPHWPLVVMTVLTQLSVGAFATIWVLQLAGVTELGVAALASLAVAGLALSASTLHLGRPIHAYRAIRMWKRSWLSREVLLFSAFSGVAGLYAGLLWMLGSADAGLTMALGGVTVICGLAGVVASGCIYRVEARPAWNSPMTLVQFVLTACVLGPPFAAAIGAGNVRWLAPAAVATAMAQLVVLAVRFLNLTAAESVELRGTARLLSTVLASRFLARGLLLIAGGVVLPLLWGSPGAWSGWVAASVSLLLTLASELLGRYLFFVSVVPRHMATPYLAMEVDAA
jgi:Fe-S-cluster-containing dehydrogenase component/DMSO reductase anchor subunit